MDEIKRVVAEVGCVITGATPDLVPADRKLYALRDVTATVPSISLIAASIMSKKLAEGLDALVLDVKFGSGAFMKTAKLARDLAAAMVATGQRMDLATTALLTDMNQPLGRMVGNAVEVDEALATLEGRGPADLVEITLALGAELLIAACGLAPDAARAQLQRTISTGAARERFAQMVAAQGGDLDVRRPVAPASDVVADRAGYVAAVNAEKLGQAIIALGGGRRQLGEQLDHSTGIEMLARLGDRVDARQPLVRVFANSTAAANVQPMLLEAIDIADESPAVGPLILEQISP
jgi:pyrimidine-nucleoside phosphorylase